MYYISAQLFKIRHRVKQKKKKFIKKKKQKQNWNVVTWEHAKAVKCKSIFQFRNCYNPVSHIIYKLMSVNGIGINNYNKKYLTYFRITHI